MESDAYLTYFSSKVLPVFDTIPASKRAVVIRQITNHVQGAEAKLTRSLLEAVWTLTKVGLITATMRCWSEDASAESAYLCGG